MTESGRDGDRLDAAIRDSVGGRLASAATATFSRAWPSSKSARMVAAFTVGWRARSRPDRLRLLALLGAIATMVNRAMARLGPHEPYTGILPWIGFAVCVAAAALAGPIAERWERLSR